MAKKTTPGWETPVAGRVLAAALDVDPDTLTRWSDAGMDRPGGKFSLLAAARFLAAARRAAPGRRIGEGLTDEDDAPGRKFALEIQRLEADIERLRLANEKTSRGLVPVATLHGLADGWARAGAILGQRLEAVVLPHGPAAVGAVNAALEECEREATKTLADILAAVDAGRLVDGGGDTTGAAGPAPIRKSRGGRPPKGNA